MNLERVELADIHHPRKLAKAVHDLLGPIDTCVPVVDIAKGLDIGEVNMCPLDGIEGMLLTDRVRRVGSILANTTKGIPRARFTVAHELGHFLLERHKFQGGVFKCSSADMRRVSAGSEGHQRQEYEANEFAISLLAPPYLVSPVLSAVPDLSDALVLRDRLNISLEASVRLLISYRHETVAAIWTKNGTVRYFVPSPAFPKLRVQPGHLLPSLSAASRFVASQIQGISGICETSSEAWSIDIGLRMTEQTRLGRFGHAVTFLCTGFSNREHAD